MYKIVICGQWYDLTLFFQNIFIVLSVYIYFMYMIFFLGCLFYL